MRLGLDFGAIEAVTLSHGHWDHAGGIPRALAMIGTANGGCAVPLFLHPGMFHERGQRQSDGGVLPMEPIPTPAQWTAFGAEPIVTDAPQTVLDDMFFISGEIPRVTSYEKGLARQVRRVADDAPWELGSWQCTCAARDWWCSALAPMPGSSTCCTMRAPPTPK